MIRDYYKLLGVTPNASAKEIKQAYRRLARLYHPDVNTMTRDEQIKRLNEAYEILSNTRRRTAYDKLLRQARLRAEEALAERQPEEPRPLEKHEPEMSWMQGVFGFVRELRKGLRED